jgi:NAD(P)H-hydrate epimerase
MEVERITQLPTLPARPPESNKGTFGRVLVVAGSRGMTGAAVLCGSGALRGGAGLVYVAVPEDVLGIVAAGNPCYLTAGLPHDENGQLTSRAEARILALAQQKSVIAIGPGLGRGRSITSLVLALLGGVAAPLVLDADALNALDGQTDSLRGRGSATVLTPHPGEFARLVNTEVGGVQANREGLAARFASEHGVILVLKGHRTIVTDGRRLYVNTNGNAGMATGGTGDVLTGLVAALVAQGLEAFAAAQLGVHLHGLAGDLARDAVGEVSLIATDLLEYLPRAFRQWPG